MGRRIGLATLTLLSTIPLCFGVLGCSDTQRDKSSPDTTSSASGVNAANPTPAQGLPPAITQNEFLQIETYRLWPGRAPKALSDEPAETPTLTVFRPQKGWGNGTAVVIAPGGGYISLVGALEGGQPAQWFASRGVTAFVLSYRVDAKARLPIPLLDGARAVRFVRAHAAEFEIDPARIGIMGFSAGGHLAAMIATQSEPGDVGATDPIERFTSRPDFLVLGYPWLEGTKVLADGRSSYCDFAGFSEGPRCKPGDYASFMPLQEVRDGAPPTFIYHTSDDELVPVEGSVRFYLALRAHRAPVELHVFETGPHGTGLGGSNTALSRWPELLQEWLRGRNLLPQPVDRKED